MLLASLSVAAAGVYSLVGALSVAGDLTVAGGLAITGNHVPFVCQLARVVTSEHTPRSKCVCFL